MSEWVTAVADGGGPAEIREGGARGGKICR